MTLALLMLLFPTLPAMPVRAATRCVNPGGTGGCFASIQAAVNASSAGDTVTVAAGVYIEHVVIPISLTLIGTDPATAIIDGQNTPGDTIPLVNITAGTVTVSSLTVRNGNNGSLSNAGQTTVTNCVFSGGAAGLGNMTGATLALTNSTLTNNVVGIANDGTMTVTGSTISFNSGAGIANDQATSVLTISNSTIDGNGFLISPPTSTGGGGILNNGTLTLTGSTVSNNIGTMGSGILAQHTTTVINSTITGNHAPGSCVSPCVPQGAGIGVYALVTLVHVTMSNNVNQGQFPEGLYIAAPSFATIDNSIIADSCGATPRATSGDYNVTAGACFVAPQPHDQITNPLLGPLTNNGGPTKTQAIGPGSPALDAIPAGNPNCQPTDQRGVPRPQGGGCDSGAFEYVPPVVPVPAPRPGPVLPPPLPAAMPLPRPPDGGSPGIPSPVPPHR